MPPRKLTQAQKEVMQFSRWTTAMELLIAIFNNKAASEMFLRDVKAQGTAFGEALRMIIQDGETDDE